VFGFEQLLGGKLAFINVSRKVLIEKLIANLPPDRTVIELLESINADEEVVAACRWYKDNGYRIALDDFVARPSLEPLAEMADIIKVDFLATQGDERKRVVDRYQNVQFLAEKIESHAEHETARAMGYSFFQGYFFCRPEIVSSKTVASLKLNQLRFLREVNSEVLNLTELEQIIKQDVSLSVKLLRFLNSAYFAWKDRITSIRHALVLLGERQLKTWASLISVAGIAEDKPSELAVTAMTRARLCELLAPLYDMDDRSFDLFLLGMLSLIDALLDRKMSEVLLDFPVSEEVKMALLGSNNRFRGVLDVVTAYERGEFDRAVELAVNAGIDPAKVLDCYNEAVAWADQIFTATTTEP
jgi:EAL and modified HD-GYP domain-containing signal transduction protein